MSGIKQQRLAREEMVRRGERADASPREYGERDKLPEEAVSASGGRMRYFLDDASGQSARLDAVKDLSAHGGGEAERYLAAGWREVGVHAWQEYRQHHAGAVRLDGVLLDDLTHTKLRNWVTLLNDNGRTASVRGAVAGIISQWVEAHLTLGPTQDTRAGAGRAGGTGLGQGGKPTIAADEATGRAALRAGLGADRRGQP